MHRGKTFVIAISGEALEHAKANEMLGDIVLFSTLGANIVVVHGARPQIEKQLEKNNHQTRIHKGLRITDNKTLEISKAAIGATRLEIENTLNRALNRPPVINGSLGILSGNFLTAKPLGVIDGVDYIYTGKLRKINHELRSSLLNQSNIILISPLGSSPTGQIYNIRYEEIAGHLAGRLSAEKLIFLHSDHALSKHPRHCNLEQLDSDLNKNGSALLSEISNAMHQGVERVHLIDINDHGGLLLELYTRDGVGCMLSTQRYDETRPAESNDVNGIIKLIRPLEAQGALTKRSREKIELDIQHFSVIERDGLIIGCAALHPIEGTDIGELSCLAIHESYRSGKRGILLVEYIKEKALQFDLRKLFVLTTQSTDWFRELGFEEEKVTALPSEYQNSYNTKRNSKVLLLKITQ